MKRKMYLTILVALSVCVMAACNNVPENSEENMNTDLILQENSEIEEDIEIVINTEAKEENIEVEFEISSEIVEENETEVSSEIKEDSYEELNYETIENLTFDTLSQYSYYFSSGAGGWGEEFIIERDGFFKGTFHDSDMGVTGEDYPDGTFYSSNYSGYFENLKKIDEYSYEMTMREIIYKEVPGTEEISDGTYYIYTDAYCLGGNDTFKVYLPGAPLNILSEDVLSWIQYSNKSDTVLTMLIIVDEENGYGICSYERLSALDEATMYYNSYKESYDYYTELLQEAYTTMEMVDNASRRYEIADECLNILWDIVRYEVEGEEYDKLLNEQREWIKEKEEQAQANADEWEGGSGASVAYYDTLADMTMERCEELFEYLK